MTTIRPTRYDPFEPLGSINRSADEAIRQHWSRAVNTPLMQIDLELNDKIQDLVTYAYEHGQQPGLELLRRTLQSWLEAEDDQWTAAAENTLRYRSHINVTTHTSVDTNLEELP